MSQTFIHCALAVEARAIIDAYKLKQLHAKPFTVYGKDNVFLLVSGIGKTLTAAALGFVYGKYAEEEAVWLNVGIAGAKGHEVGEVLIGNKLMDLVSGNSFYPPLIVNPDIKSTVIHTVEQPETKFKSEGLYDMEAATFFSVANRFSTAELVQSIKVVSDTHQSGVEHVNKELVVSLMKEALPSIEKFKSLLEHVAESFSGLDASADFAQELMEKWKFSVTQKSILRTQLRSLMLLDNSDEWTNVISSCSNSREVLSMLDRLLETRVPAF